MELNKLELSDFTALFDVIWLDNMESMKREAFESGIWKVLQIPQNTGESRRMSEIDLEEYASRKAEGEQAGRAKIQQGYTKDLSQYRVAEDIGVTYEMRTQNKAPEVIARLENLARLPFNRMELDLSHRISYATATSYTDRDGETIDTTGGDDLAWASTAHTLNGSSSTYRNRLANNPQLSKGALEAMERMVKENTLNQFGEKMVVPYDILWTTDDAVDMNVAMEYLESVGSPDFVNANVKNVYQFKYRHVALPRVATTAAGAVDTTKRHYWGLASSMATTAYIGIWEEPHTLPFEEVKDRSDSFVAGVRAGWGICHVSGRGFAFSSGDGTA